METRVFRAPPTRVSIWEMEIEDDVSKKKNSNNKEIDSSAGSLVWVRRRNGSWWPGRVLGLYELPENCSSSKRIGTPIMLLGKEDGSVDWFNFEKSTRIKAFRCGEYDECIERAKDRALHPSRKAANTRKYVRREYAILHALKLEEARSFEGNQKNNSSTVKANKKFDPQSNKIGHIEPVYVGRKHKSHKKSSQKLSHTGMSFEHRGKLSTGNMQYSQQKRSRMPNDSEDDTTEGMKRMRDLQDLGGMNIKRKPNGYVPMEGFQDLALPDSASLSDSDFNNDLSSEEPINSSRDSCSSLKRKRHAGQVYDSLKKKCRRRSLAEVWMGASPRGSVSEESSLQAVTNIRVKIDNPTSKKINFISAINDSPSCSGTSSEEALLNTCENTGNTASGRTHFNSRIKDGPFPGVVEYIEHDLSDGFIDVTVTGGKNAAELPPAFDAFPSTKLNSSTEENQSNHSIKVSLVSQLNERPGEACSTSSSTKVNNNRPKIDTGASEWHTKGKRNARHLPLKTMNSASDESLTSDSSCQQINQNPKISSKKSLPPREIRLPSRYRVSEQNSSHLYDVELRVQSNYQGQLVPLVSLMSKFNGKAIVGHPVTVEIFVSGRHINLTVSKAHAKGKKTGFSPSKKIRRLSSFVLDRKHKEDGGPTVSCIPLRLVFSRLNEALSSSARAAN